jgi:hypothetical protein
MPTLFSFQLPCFFESLNNDSGRALKYHSFFSNYFQGNQEIFKNRPIERATYLNRRNNVEGLPGWMA